MGATINDIVNTGYHIIDTDIEIRENLVIGDGSTLCFRGGRFVNNSHEIKRTITGNNIQILAAAEHIFVGNIEILGKWLMERAYPQWFGAKSCADILYSKTGISLKKAIDELEDSSVAINKAIKLKVKGEVFIPRGFYKLERFINVPIGVQLIGEGCDFEWVTTYGTILFPWVNGCDDNNIPESRFGNLLLDAKIPGDKDEVNITVNLSDDIMFPRCSENADWPNAYMMTVNIADESTYMCTYLKEIGSKYEYKINYIIYDWARRYPPYGTKVSNIGFADITEVVNIGYEFKYGFMRGIMFDGCLELFSLRVYLLSQFCFCTGREYTDGRSIRNCVFNPPNGYIPRNKIYGFDVRGLGDSLDFYNNHASDYQEKIGALYIRGTNGANVSNNILNSDILIEQSKAVNFSSNHSEYGAQIDIRDSAVTLSDNFIWRGPNPSIILRRLQYPITTYSSSVVLSNNIFIYYDNSVNWLSHCNEISPYDIVTDGYATVKISNCFRTKGTPDITSSNYIGIQAGKFDLIANEEGNFIWDSGVYYPLDDFNGHSYINSCDCSINNLTVYNMPAKVSKFNSFSIDYSIVSNGDEYVWLDPLGSTEPLAYKIIVICDITRKIALYKNDFGPSVTPKSDKDNIEFRISGIYDNAILRLVRKSTQNEFWCVHLPLCGAHKLYDNYSSVSGYKWENYSGTEMEFNTDIEIVTYMGSNVECMSTSFPAYGEWTNGDIVYDINPGKEGKYWIFMNNIWVYK